MKTKLVYGVGINDADYVLTKQEKVNGKWKIVWSCPYYERWNTGIDNRTDIIIRNAYSVQYPGYGEEAYTVREVLGYIGAFYAGNWIINDSGQLRLLVLGDIPAETYYLITEDGDRITLGGDRLVMT